MINEVLQATHGIVHAGFSGLRAFVARKKSRCKLIGNRFVIPHDTIPSNVTAKCKKNETTDNLLLKEKRNNEQLTHKTAHLQIAQTNTRPKFAKELFPCQRI